MAKKKTNYLQRRKNEEKINTKALIWIGAAIVVFIVALSVMLALQ